MNLLLVKLRLYAPLVLLAGALFALGGCELPGSAPAAGGPSAVTPPQGASPVGTDGLREGALQKGDLVTINFTGPQTAPGKHEERIKEDGQVDLYLLGRVQAAGKTPGQLQREIQNLYVPKYYQYLTVTVTTEARFYTVAGQVRNPGQIRYLGETTVLRAIAGAGDFTDYAKRTKVALVRVNGQKFTVNCVKALGNDQLDLPVFPGDRIFVPRRLW